MMLLSSGAGNDLLFDETKLQQGKAFVNKITNAYRLVSGWEVSDTIDQPSSSKIAIEWYPYITAPAYLTSGEKGPQVLFIENIEENIDTFSVAKAQHNSLNAVIYLEYDFTDKWGVGFNIDAAGIAFGKEVVGTPVSSNKPMNTANKLSAKPTAYNVLLISDNDIGMLNSELYVKYNVTKKLTVNAGFTFLFTEYTTTEKISYSDNNDRFRYKSLLGMISINYKPFKK